MKLRREKINFEAMTTDQLAEWAEANPHDPRLYLIIRILTARCERARNEINETIRELGTKAKDYLDSIGVEIHDEDEDQGDSDNNNDIPILLEENVGEQKYN